MPVFSVILVSGSDNSGNGAYRTVEVLFANGTLYSTLPDLPDNRYYHSQDGLNACGGGSSGTYDNCVTLTDGQWTQSHTLLYNRIYHTSWALEDGRLVLMGGSISRRTTEILSPGTSTTTEGFTLKYDTKYS